MLVTVALMTCCLLGGVAAQDSPIGRTAYKQLMVGCLGETPYREYLESVAAARRECGGGLDERGFFTGLANMLHNPAFARFPSVQGIPLSQPGSVVLQRPPGAVQIPGGFPQSRGTPQHPGVFPQQPGVFPSQAGILQRQPGFFQPSSSVIPQPGIFPQESGLFPSLLNDPTVSITDSLPSISSPVGPSYPGIRQKRQAGLNLADIQQLGDIMRARVNNFTCILTKLAVVNTNLDLNHQGLTKSVVNLPVAGVLKRDLLTAINYCSDMTRCLPLEKQQLPVPHKLKRIMEYVKCEKEMRLKACHKHSLRQHVQNINIGRLPLDGSQFNTVEDIVTLLVDAQSSHELELI